MGSFCNTWESSFHTPNALSITALVVLCAVIAPLRSSPQISRWGKHECAAHIGQIFELYVLVLSTPKFRKQFRLLTDPWVMDWPVPSFNHIGGHHQKKVVPHQLTIQAVKHSTLPIKHYELSPLGFGIDQPTSLLVFQEITWNRPLSGYVMTCLWHSTHISIVQQGIMPLHRNKEQLATAVWRAMPDSSLQSVVCCLKEPSEMILSKPSLPQ